MPESGLSAAEFASVFPFHFTANEERRIVGIGPSLQKLLPDLRLGCRLSDAFRVERTSLDLDGPRLEACLGGVMLLQAVSRPQVTLRGELRRSLTGDLRFLGAPLISSLEELEPLGLSLEDFPQHDVQGDLLLLVAAKDVALRDAQDLSRRLSELGERLVRSEAWFRSLLRGSGDCIAVLNAEGMLRWINHAGARLFGSTPELLSGKRFLDLVHAHDAEKMEAAWAAVLQAGSEPERLEFRSAYNEGASVLEGMFSDARQDASVAGVILNAHDVTRQRLLRDQLLRAQKMESLGQLAGGIAHDFNNLLMVIFYGLQMIEDALPANSPLRTHTHEIEQAGDRARALTRQILSFARRSFSAPRIVNLQAVTADIVRFLSRIAGPQFRIKTEASKLGAETSIDIALVEQALVGLVLNARDMMTTGGELLVEVERVERDVELTDFCGASLGPGSWLVISLLNTGVSIADVDLQSLLDPFGGSGNFAEKRGIGLAGTYGLTRQHGGGMFVENITGRGVRISVHLPIAVSAQEVQTSAATRPSAAKSLRVLLVEDDTAVRSMVHRMLGQLGHEVRSAGDAREALKIAGAAEFHVDVLLSDIVMPGLSGPEAAALLLQRHPKMKVLFMSGYFDESIARYGADPTKVLAKPFNRAQLQARLDELMAS
jgi:PAS domain S-box-containing protein